jgi:precorrin-2 dehydrogenase / sirohydrochlorin ferrochelatase
MPSRILIYLFYSPNSFNYYIIEVMGKYPIFLELGGRRAVVIGAGAVATRKAQTLLTAGARVVVIADAVDESMQAICAVSSVELVKAKYSKEYLAGAIIIIAATNDNQLNKQIYKDCQELEILCNVVDEPQLCDFFVPAVVKKGDLQIAIGTEGNCPAYAGHIRKKLEEIFTEKHGEFVSELETIRKRINEQIKNPARRKTILGELVDDASFDYFVKNGAEKWRNYASETIIESQPAV